MKRLPLLSLLLLAATFIVHSCGDDVVPPDKEEDPDTRDSLIWPVRQLDVNTQAIQDTIYFDVISREYYPSQKVHLGLLSQQPRTGWDIDIHGAVTYIPYAPGSSKARLRIQHGRLQNGTWPLNIWLGTNAYKGTITADAAGFTISWAHDNIINIHPKIFPR